jgi:hypothetical protein
VRTSLAFVGVTATVVLTAAVTIPANADVATTVSLAGRQAPTTAAGSGVQDCPASGARRGLDTWSFALPSDRFDFTTVKARFAPRRDARVATFVAIAPGPRGTATGKRATVVTPRGLWLIGASASVTGKGKKPTQFTLARTCAAAIVARPEPDTVANPPAQPPAAEYPVAYPSAYPTEDPTAYPTASPPVTAEPGPSETTAEPEEEYASPAESAESEASVTRSDTRGEDGMPPAAMALVAALLAGGLLASIAVLFVAVRRRRATNAANDTDEPTVPTITTMTTA